ncbi:signal peptide peptidase SppA [Flavobacterium alvei]|uniref:Signal peptide peptidase SppA n=1 Tax=Flavobacterium alvei TaxID=2080416 RepID=A0A2S5AG01_9FLAO|nr:signal peptide peptidase SppA [Flavobacterium alvei]POY41501.1 signal peptide peptidase SppA [Flavobacterium alvei]HQE33126.1 signal peptide peptidase SppA [Flavobacterium alvei]HQF47625.1 signal peptide peptidase SppA [Flavobacterium alvei]HQK40129.1 signal peptide peptidase SppA [Flavobacterium alvei]
MRFLGNVLATIVGLFVFIMLFVFGIVLIGMLFGGESDEISVKSNSVIELKLDEIKNDYAGKYNNPWVTEFSKGGKVGLSDVIKAIEAAKTDSDIKGISILNDESELGMAQRKALRNALEDFKKSGKFVMAYANSYSQKEYYLNSVANTIYINPVGDFDFKGLSAELMFFKDLQEKSGIKMEVIRHGKYKSAVEPFLENGMSDANREQTTSLLNAVWSSVLADISKSRNISVAKLNEIASGLLARTPEMAKSEKLVDVIAYEDEYHDAIKKILKVDKDEDYNKTAILDYAQKVATTSESNDSNDKIAIIYAQGEIMSGEGDINTIGEISMNRSLIEARKDKDVKAIVLRINSPGGNALTSDLIWREIELTKKVKPVVVSMGNYAASGGYYIACNANKIFAENNTITGSIGVFGILPNFTQLATKIGIHTEQVKTNENASEYSPFVPMDEKFKAVTLESVEHIYKTFVSHVAKGRKMTIAQVDSIGQGRVWSGSQALKIGLVDKIGGLDAAIKEAALLGKTKKYSTQNFPEFEKDMSDLLKNFPFAKSKESFIKEELGEETYRLMEQIKKVQARKGVQAMMPFEINIQ